MVKVLSVWMIALSSSFAICGLGLLIVASFAIDSAVKYLMFVSERYIVSSGVSLSLSIVSVALACHVYYDVFTKTPHLMILLFLVFAGLVGIVFSSSTFAYYFTGQMLESMNTSMIKHLHQYESNNESKHGMDYLQLNMNCCGVRNGTDYLNVTGFNITSLPSSCCGNKNESCKLDTGVQGCLDVLYEVIQYRLKVMASLIIATALLEMLALGVATLHEHTLLFPNSSNNTEVVKEDKQTEKVSLEGEGHHPSKDDESTAVQSTPSEKEGN